ncbi:hypothetical protein HYPSUDRAFT_77508 [Hypholoma sublateritium FD-334 SS-4]|uniref:N-acetyltransferase domain-containing protein n=1 Tax=Hypholoma sublateritium (strain FD-334 SS-4) TaxID=945553 RepID=A0A0D2NTI7_HYPSF|nr:hypothetical protein HYPSUDRAFT_77508 [Hypholoma sublateritium FD-334 SS-4]
MSEHMEDGRYCRIGCFKFDIKTVCTPTFFWREGRKYDLLTPISYFSLSAAWYMPSILRFIVPRGAKLKDEFKDAIENQTEMFCIIDTMPISSESTSTTETAPTDGQPAARRVAWYHDTPRFVGFTALWAHPERGIRRSEFSLVLLPEAQGKGIGTAVTRSMLDHAFIHLYMHRIWLAVFEGNDKAIAVYRKCGFVEEGRMRKANWFAGQWKDEIYMGILIEDWTETKKVAKI